MISRNGGSSERALSNSGFHTNQIMIHEHNNTSKTTLTVFLPGYIKLKVKNISLFDIAE